MASPRYRSDKADPAPLGKPLHFEFSGKTAPNRFLKAAMTERLSSWHPTDLHARGVPSKGLINVYKRWGEGELGLILTGNTMIHLEHLEAAGNPIVPADAPASGERFEAFKEMARVSKAHGSLILSQLSHPGRQTSADLQPHPISASDVKLPGKPMGLEFAKPRAMTQEDITENVATWAHAAEFLYKAGYDGVELHGAHGYLLAQFLSPATNLRTDKYGGNLENRSRIIFEIIAKIRERVPDKKFMIGIKLNSVEFEDKGFKSEECRQLCANLEKHEIDFVELSGGTYEQLAFSHKRESTKKRESFFLEFAETIAPALHRTRSYITGGLRTVGAMVKALDVVDGIGLARPVCQEPFFCRDILSGRISGAIEQKVDQNDFGLTNLAAGTQIKMLAQDQQPVDLSDEEKVKQFQQGMQAWMKKMGEDEKHELSGYIPLPDGRPYANTAVSASS